MSWDASWDASTYAVGTSEDAVVSVDLSPMGENPVRQAQFSQAISSTACRPTPRVCLIDVCQVQRAFVDNWDAAVTTLPPVPSTAVALNHGSSSGTPPALGTDSAPPPRLNAAPAPPVTSLLGLAPYTHPTPGLNFTSISAQTVWFQSRVRVSVLRP